MSMAVKVALSGHKLVTHELVTPGMLAVLAMASPAERLAAVQARRNDLLAASEKVVADAGDEDLTDEQSETITSNAAEIEKLDKQINALQLLQPKGQGRKTVPGAGSEGGGGGDQRLNPGTVRDSARHDFKSFGSFAQAVRNASLRKDSEDVRKLMAAATTYGNEGTGAEGGYLVPPSFSTDIWKKVQAEENLMNRCTPLVTDGNSMMLPKDETTPWQTTGGVLVYWEGEAQAVAGSKPLFEMGALRLSKLMALVPISEELLADASGIESWLRAKAPAKMAAKLNTAIVAGTGAGQPLGMIPSYAAVGASVVQVSKETSQPADTIWMKNIEKMYSRMYASWRRNAAWFINQDLEPQLAGMAFQASGASSDLPGTSAVPAYLPPGGLSNSPYGTLKGRPVIPIEACSAIGDLGDIIFADLSQYWILTKSGGMQTDTSIHLYFDQALTAFRFIFRVNGQPAWSSTITRQNGSSNELSWAVALQAR